MFAIKVEGRYPVAHCLCDFRRRFVYCLPHFFKDGLDIRRKGPDVSVNSREGLFSCHIFPLSKGDQKSVARTPTPGMAHASTYKFSDWPAAGPPQWQSRFFMVLVYPKKE